MPRELGRVGLKSTFLFVSMPPLPGIGEAPSSCSNLGRFGRVGEPSLSLLNYILGDLDGLRLEGPGLPLSTDAVPASLALPSVF